MNYSVSRPTVQKHMREMGIAAIHPMPNLSCRNHEHKVYPYLLHGIVAKCPCSGCYLNLFLHASRYVPLSVK